MSQENFLMGGACSLKRDYSADGYGLHRGISGMYFKCGYSKERRASVHSNSGCPPQGGSCPSLMELCIYKIRQEIHKYTSFYMLPRDISQLIFNDLASCHALSDCSIKAFRDCALQDICLADYPGVRDSWMDVITSQGSSLLTIQLSSSGLTDVGLAQLKNCSNLQALLFDRFDNVSEHGLKQLDGCLSNLAYLGFIKSNALTREGMQALSSLFNLEKLDFDRCPRIHGGLVHLKGLTKLKSLKIRCCKCITDSDMESLAGLINLKELQISSVNITNIGVSYLEGLSNLISLTVEGCNVTASCLDPISAFRHLKVLNLGFNDVTDACLVHLKGLTRLESLNLDSTRVGDGGLANLVGLQGLRKLHLSDTEVGSEGLRHLSGLTNLEEINLAFTSVTDGGLEKLSQLTNLKSLNLDAPQITDHGLEMLTGLTEVTHLDLFGAHISDSGVNCLSYFKNLQSLDLCGGKLTDAGVKNIKYLTSLMILNLSQNLDLTDTALKFISGLVALVCLNVSYSRITNEGLEYLKPLKNLSSLYLDFCNVTGSGIRKLQSKFLPSLVRFRPEC
nr:F-box/LRR-repeat protein 14-like isoform X3 [Coffea arabica]